MNNIYVDELPKCCLLCVQNCGARQKDISCFNMDCEGCIGGRPKNCPLKPLTDRLAEERKKVCEQIYKLFTNESMWKTMKDWWLQSGTCRELKLVLDAIEKETTNQEIIEQFSKDREYYALFNKLKEENNG